MHDQRRQVEERVDRVLRERIRPAKYTESIPLDVSAVAGPGRAGAGRRRLHSVPVWATGAPPAPRRCCCARTRIGEANGSRDSCRQLGPAHLTRLGILWRWIMLEMWF